MRKLIGILLVSIIVFCFSSCSDGKAESDGGALYGEETDVLTSETEAEENASAVERYTVSDEDRSTTAENATYISCDGTNVSFSGNGAVNRSGTVTISKAGCFVISGKLSGSLVVEAGKNDTVHLVFDGVDITGVNTASVNVKKAEKVIITLAEGTENTLGESGELVYDDVISEEPSAALFSKGDLVINGEGSLTVNADFNDGIASKDNLCIVSGNVTVNSSDDGIVGRDAFISVGGNVVIDAGGDGIKTTNDENSSLGYMEIQGGEYKITAGADGIQAETDVEILGGSFSITTGGGSANASYSENGGFNESWGDWPIGGGPGGPGGHGGPGGPGGMMGGFRGGYSTDVASDSETSNSAKGIKAAGLINISGGKLSIDSSDDSIHSNGDIVIGAGEIEAASGDDGIHADASLTVNGGAVSITKSYEGMEACNITLNGGDITVKANDDAINGAGGNDSSALGGRPGQNNFASSNASLVINGGNICADASGDGIDINGNITMNGGVVLVYGPTNSGNASLDYDRSFEINGGTFAALGASGMMQGATGGEQASFACGFSTVDGGKVIAVENSSGEVIFSFYSDKSTQSLVFSSESLQVGEEYTVVSALAQAEAENGIYSGEYTNRTVLTSVEQSSTVIGAGGGHGFMW